MSLGVAHGLLVALLEQAGRAQRHPLVVELADDEVPAVVLAADEVVGRHPHVVVVDGVDVVARQQVSGSMVMPGVFLRSTMSIEMPLCLGASGSVRTASQQ